MVDEEDSFGYDIGPQGKGGGMDDELFREIEETFGYDRDKAFDKANNALDRLQWSKLFNDGETAQLGARIDREDKYGLSSPNAKEVVRQNEYIGEAGTLKVSEVEDLVRDTEASYDPSIGARPESEQVHGAILHAVAVLSEHDAKSDSRGISVESIDEGDAREIIQAYSIIDSALEREQRGINESAQDLREQGYGLEGIGSGYLEGL